MEFSFLTILLDIRTITTIVGLVFAFLVWTLSYRYQGVLFFIVGDIVQVINRVRLIYTAVDFNLDFPYAIMMCISCACYTLGMYFMYVALRNLRNDLENPTRRPPK
jgi:hypothetical protein